MGLVDKIIVKFKSLLIDAESRHLRSQLRCCGDNVRIDHRVFVWSPQKVAIGNNVDINGYTVIYGGGEVEIGSNTLIAANCVIASVTHPIDIELRRELVFEKVTIKENCWLGANVVVLPGVTIGRNSIVAAGSVVTEDIPQNSIVAGGPAKLMRTILESKGEIR